MESLTIENHLQPENPGRDHLGKLALSGLYPHLRQLYRQRQTNKGYARWAGSLAERSSGRFVMAPPEKKKLYQDTDTHYFPSAVNNSGGIQRNEQAYTDNLYWLTGEAANMFAADSFFDAVDKLRDSELIATLPEASQTQNIAMITPHPSLSSPFVEELAVAYAISDPKVTQRMSIILSPTLGWLEVPVTHNPEGQQSGRNSINAIKIVSRLFNVWPVMPDNAKKYGLEKHMAAHNQPVTRAMINHLRHERGNIVALNPSGSLDLVNQKNQGIEMQTIKDTRAKFISKYFDSAFFVVSWANPKTGEFDLRVSDGLIPLREPIDVHRVMEDMARPYYELVNGTQQPGGTPIWYGDLKIAR